MKKLKQFIASLLALCLLLGATTLNGQAAEDLDVTFRISSKVTEAGREVTVTLSLEGYTQEAIPICGIQADVGNIDPAILSVADGSPRSLIEDNTGVLSNTAQYIEKNKLIRLLYMRLSGSLAAPQSDICEMRFVMNPELSEEGTLVLPLTAKFQREKSDLGPEQLIIKKEISLSYAPAREVTSVDISWGELDYEYQEGSWNPDRHIYDEGVWNDSGTGFVTIENTGNTAARASLVFQSDAENISGTFENGQKQKVSEADLSSG